MPLRHIPLDQLTEAHLQGLIVSGAPESRTIDYKAALPLIDKDNKREFLADVSSFANASGGDLLIGIEESGGVATLISGLSGVDLDKLKQQLDHLMRDGLQPRLLGVQMREVATSAGPVLVIRVQRSWIPPHRVIAYGDSRFFSRNSHGKYSLDVPELRQLFLQSEALGERTRRFRAERLAAIIAGETPTQLIPGSIVVLHIVPFVTTDATAMTGIDILRGNRNFLRTLDAGGSDTRPNLDGVAVFGPAAAEGQRVAYTQAFRNAAIECVDVGIIGERDAVQAYYAERRLIDAVPDLLAFLSSVGVEPPMTIMVSLLGVMRKRLAVNENLLTYGTRVSDRKDLLLPEVIVTNYAVDMASLMRPAFDALWNAFGWERCFDYGEDGTWGR